MLRPPCSYRKAMAEDPRRASYVSNAAAALAALGRRREACDACLAAAALDGKFERPRTRLAQLAATPDGFEDAFNAAVQAQQQQPDKCERQRRVCASCGLLRVR